MPALPSSHHRTDIGLHTQLAGGEPASGVAWGGAGAVQLVIVQVSSLLRSLSGVQATLEQFGPKPAPSFPCPAGVDVTRQSALVVV
jgi:hypothetical protein